MSLDSDKIKEELAKIGVLVNSIYDLVNTRESYPQAIPILIELLKQGVSDESNQREGVIRSLAVKEARGIACEALLAEYLKTPKEKEIVRWVIGNTMTVVMTENEIDSVLNIVKDKENGMSRQMFVLALGKFKKFEEVEPTLIELLDDDEVVIHAMSALRKIKSVKARKK